MRMNYMYKDERKKRDIDGRRKVREDDQRSYEELIKSLKKK